MITATKGVPKQKNVLKFGLRHGSKCMSVKRDNYNTMDGMRSDIREDGEEGKENEETTGGETRKKKYVTPNAGKQMTGNKL